MILHLITLVTVVVGKSNALNLGTRPEATSLASPQEREALIKKVVTFADDQGETRMTTKEAAAKYGLTSKQIDEIKFSDVATTSADCLSEVFRMVDKPDMVGLGDAIVAKFENGSIIYSPNGRSTLVTNSGNCGPSGTTGQKDFKSILKSAFDAGRKRVSAGLVSSDRFDKVVSRCQSSKNPVIHDVAAGLIGTNDQEPGQSGSPIFDPSRPFQLNQGAGSTK